MLGCTANGPGCGAAEEKERGERAGLLGCGERRGRGKAGPAWKGLGRTGLGFLGWIGPSLFLLLFPFLFYF